VFRLLALAAAMAIPALAHAAAPEITWRDRYYNPKPLDGDLVLPMPCGGAMVFRPVAVPAEKLLGDRKLVLGGTDDRFAYAESSRADHIAGSFPSGTEDGGRLYYIGKYEVTDDQYAALHADGKCPRASNIGRLAKTSASWIESMDFAARYTEWLYANAKDLLPKVDGVAGFLRLPTETEWEYAARGGAAVSESEFVAPLFPMEGPLAEHAWYGAPESSDFKRQATGLLKPNPVGLFDILGNAGEMVLDPYRLNKVSRLHGQSGGVTVRGGDFFTPRDAIRTAQRQEMNPFDETGPRRLETVGFRLAISAPVVTSKEKLETIQAEWEKLPEVESALTGTERLEDPLDEIAVLIDATRDPAFKDRLKDLRTVMRASIATRNEQRDRAARNLLRSGLYLAQRILDAERIRAGRENIFKIIKPEYKPEEETYRAAERNWKQSEEALEITARYYRDTIVELIRDYPASIVGSQGKVLNEELNARGMQALGPILETFLVHVERFRKSGKLPSSEIVSELK
jgi:hypothetical protein